MRAMTLPLAVARLTRFVTSDSLGDWMVVGPARRWANRAERFPDHLGEIHPSLLDADVDEDAGWRSKLVSGLECPFCVGFWVGAGMLAGEKVTRHTRMEPIWDLATSALALNYVVAHASSRLD